jgi:hypothetical protein
MRGTWKPWSFSPPVFFGHLNAEVVAVVNQTAGLLKPNPLHTAIGEVDFKPALAGLVTEKCFCAHSADYIIIIRFVLFIHPENSQFR